jgi:hypothetical protein
MERLLQEFSGLESRRAVLEKSVTDSERIASEAGAQADRARSALNVISSNLAEAREGLKAVRAEMDAARGEFIDRKRFYETESKKMGADLEACMAEANTVKAALVVLRGELAHVSQLKATAEKELADVVAGASKTKAALKAEIKEFEDTLNALRQRAARA